MAVTNQSHAGIFIFLIKNCAGSFTIVVVSCAYLEVQNQFHNNILKSVLHLECYGNAILLLPVEML